MKSKNLEDLHQGKTRSGDGSSMTFQRTMLTIGNSYEGMG